MCVRKERAERKQLRKQAGLITVFTALAVSALLAFVALAVDVGWMVSTRTQLQNAADATARAAMQSALDMGLPGGAPQAALDEAQAVAEQHLAGGIPVQLSRESDLSFGFYDFPSRTFSAGLGPGSPAVHVTARRAPDAPAGPLQLFFAPVVGIGSANVVAEAVAVIRRRDLIIVQDRTVSFRTEFPDAQAAARGFVDGLVGQGISGDRVGVIQYSRIARQRSAFLAATAANQWTLDQVINGMEACRNAFEFGCRGTDIGVGINEARAMFAAQPGDGLGERIIVIVADGVPCYPESANAFAVGMADAVAAANQAAYEGLNIFIATVDGHGPDFSPNGCVGLNVNTNESLARGFGRGYTVPSIDELEGVLRSIAGQMPVRLVR